jgi:hypothetical protein
MTDVYVVVTRSDAGIQHTWGLFPSKSSASTFRQRILREHARDYPGRELFVSVHKVFNPATEPLVIQC